jgi:hypothetical protein
MKCDVDDMTGSVGDPGWRNHEKWGRVHYTRQDGWHTIRGTHLAGDFEHLALKLVDVPDLPTIAPHLLPHEEP